MEHHFNIVIAKNFGVDEAIMIHNLYFWISKNEANEKHFYDGEYWTYNSMEAFTKLFPYWSKRQVERILNSLIEKGLIIKGNYNQIAYDRTSWYSITQIVKCIYANGEMDVTEWLNGNHQTVTPIPDSNTDSKPISKPSIDFDSLLVLIKEKTKREFVPITDKVKRKYLSRLKEGYTKKHISIAIKNAVKDEYHISKNYRYLTPEFFSRSETLDKYADVTEIKEPVKNNNVPLGPWNV